MPFQDELSTPSALESLPAQAATLPAGLVFSISSLRLFMRAVPDLTAGDSVGRFLRVARQCACSSLPVVRGNRLLGMAWEADARRLLRADDPGAIEAALRCPLADILRAPDIVIRPDMTPEEARGLFQRHDLDLLHALPVVDSEGYCLGVVVYNDLLVAEGPAARPGTIGGMATPFGVYLTDGTVQAGAGNGALVASGMAMGLLLLVAFGVTDQAAQWLQHTFHALPARDLMDTGDLAARVSPAEAVMGLALKVAAYLCFFGMLRLTNITGYHAAEHQTVHALERNEPLVCEVVRRMPRPHPRCGTNILAISLLMFSLAPLLVSVLRLDVENALVLSAFATLFAWRPFGAFLQQHFTTRPATDRQLASGIAAANALLGTYYTSRAVRPTLWRRVWCMGLLQNLLGIALVTGLAELLSQVVAHFGHFGAAGS